MTPFSDDLELVVLDVDGDTVAGYAIEQQRPITLEGGHPATLLLLKATEPDAPAAVRWCVGVVSRAVPQLLIGRGADNPAFAQVRFEQRALAGGAR